MFPYSYICIEGNIGSGKTSLCQMIAREYDCKLILEQFAENPFLPYFYKDPERYAFPVELFFMTERHKQLQGSLMNRDLFLDMTISDYFFPKTLLFARKTLGEEEYRLFQQLHQILDASFPNPDFLVYLHRPLPVLLEHIKERGRPYEQEIEAKYLQEIQDSYFEFFMGYTEYPILIIDLNERDFISDEQVYKEIIGLLKKEYSPGVHRISLV